MNKDNVSKIHDCYGCGVCAASCPVNIIDIRLNRNGFYEPFIDRQDDCIGCGICLSNCAFCHEELATDSRPLQSWGAWSLSREVRRKCSSGGVGFEILRQLQRRGLTVIACRYNAAEARAEHYLPADERLLTQSIGSKYIQSYTPEAFRQIDRKHQYAVVGTPCQIDSLRRMARRLKIEDNMVFVDFFCHCVPSMWAWRGYVDMVERKIGRHTSASWRNKLQYGWHDSWHMALDSSPEAPENPLAEHPSQWSSRMSQGDLFYKLFLGDVAMNPACSRQCKYKYDRSSADLRLGDLWGNRYSNDEDGVSALIAMTPKGVEIAGSLEGVAIEPLNFDVAAEGQMRHNAVPKAVTPLVMSLLRSRVPVNSPIYKAVFMGQKVINRINRLTRNRR